MRAPRAWNFLGFSRNSLISWSSSTASSTPATSRKVIFGEADVVLGLLRPPKDDGNRVVLRLDRGLLDLTSLELVDEVRVRVLPRLRARADELLREERQHDHDQDGECGALEKPAHKGGIPGSTGWTSLPSPHRPIGRFPLALKRGYIGQVAVPLGEIE